MNLARTTCLAVALVGTGTLARAEWPGPSGLPVASAVHGRPVALASDGAGGALVAFEGAPVPGGDAIRLQRVLADGEIAAGWPLDGVVACSLATTTHLGDLQAVSDGDGGAYLVWNESGLWYLPGIGYAQHILADGTRAPGWPARGRILVPGDNQLFHQAVADGSGGLLVAWTANHAIHSVRILANGVNAPGFPSSGRPLWDQLPLGTLDSPNFSLVPDAAGGFWAAAGLVSADTLQIPSSYRLLRVEPNGLIDSSWLGDGYGMELPIPASAWVTGGARALADGAGGAYVLARLDERAMLMHAMSWQGMDPDWPAPWLDLGVAADAWEAMAGLESDGAGGLYALWTEPYVATGRGVLRRVRTDGTLDPAWPAPISVTATMSPELIADATGVYECGMFIYTCPSQNCLGVSAVGRRSQDGSVPASWLTGPSGGLTDGEFFLPDYTEGGPVDMVRDGAGGIFAAWTAPAAPNQPYGSSGTVRVMRFVSAGPVADVGDSPTRPQLIQGTRYRPDGLHVWLSGAIAAPAELAVFDLSGRRVGDVVRDAASLGGEVLVPGTQRLRSGLYFVRLRAGAYESFAKALVAR